MDTLVTIPNASWRDDSDIREQAVSALESGGVLYIPDLGFPIEESEKPIFDDGYLQLSSKNLSYDPSTGEVRGLKSTRGADDAEKAKKA